MGVTVAAIANSLVEFILSLLRDPAAAAEFDTDPKAALAGGGLGGVTYEDVCAVTPVVVDRPEVVPGHPGDHPGPPPAPEPIDVIRSIVNNFAWVDDRDTIVDQSVNQNIWAHGDVLQNFDQAAVVASGDAAAAAGDDLDIENTLDNSTTISAGNDANLGNESTTSVVDGSYNSATDASTDTTSSTTAVTIDSLNDASTAASAVDSFNSSSSSEIGVDAEADLTVIDDSDTAVIIDGEF